MRNVLRVSGTGEIEKLKTPQEQQDALLLYKMENLFKKIA